MNPSVRDRLASVVRALNGVVLPALPKEAGLAQEQAMLAIGHIQIILAQMDGTEGFVTEEAADYANMGTAIVAAASGGTKTEAAKTALRTALQDDATPAPEARTAVIQEAIDQLLLAMAEDGEQAARSAVNATIIVQSAARSDKDRRWFAAMGFDIDYSGT